MPKKRKQKKPATRKKKRTTKRKKSRSLVASVVGAVTETVGLRKRMNKGRFEGS